MVGILIFSRHSIASVPSANSSMEPHKEFKHVPQCDEEPPRISMSKLGVTRLASRCRQEEQQDHHLPGRCPDMHATSPEARKTRPHPRRRCTLRMQLHERIVTKRHDAPATQQHSTTKTSPHKCISGSSENQVVIHETTSSKAGADPSPLTSMTKLQKKAPTEVTLESAGAETKAEGRRRQERDSNIRGRTSQ